MFLIGIPYALVYTSSCSPAKIIPQIIDKLPIFVDELSIIFIDSSYGGFRHDEELFVVAGAAIVRSSREEKESRSRTVSNRILRGRRGCPMLKKAACHVDVSGVSERGVCCCRSLSSTPPPQAESESVVRIPVTAFSMSKVQSPVQSSAFIYC